MKSAEYVIHRRKRGGHSRSWNVWILAEYSLPDENGNYQRVKTIADFGNTKRKENYQNAKKVKEFFESVTDYAI